MLERHGRKQFGEHDDEHRGSERDADPKAALHVE